MGFCKKSDELHELLTETAVQRRMDRFTDRTSNFNNTERSLHVLLVWIPKSPKTYKVKKLFSLLAIIGIILVSNCTRIPENNNPVIGIWSDVQISEASKTAKQQSLRQEWIFNDAYLGRYHEKANGSITFKTDFRWTYENEVYTITYPGTDMEEKIVSMQSDDTSEMLADADGNIMATRE